MNGEADDDSEDDHNTSQDAIQVEDIIDVTEDDELAIYWETINNDFTVPVGTEDGATGVTIEYEGVLHAQYCYFGELYYRSCDIYKDDPVETNEAIEMMDNSSEPWLLCDDAPPLQVHPMLSLRSEMEYDRQVMGRNRRLAYQGLLDNCSDVGITKAELQETQAPLNPSIRRPKMEDWERIRKYLGNVPADMVRNTSKNTTQIGTLPPSSHLRRQFKSPNPALNIHRRDEADATDQIFAKVPAVDGVETSANIFVGQDSKITDVYKARTTAVQSSSEHSKTGSVKEEFPSN